MRERAGQVEYDKEQYHPDGLLHFSKSKKRLDLNVLLKRAKDQEENDKKFNLLIFSGAASVVIVFYLLLSI